MRSSFRMSSIIVFLWTSSVPIAYSFWIDHGAVMWNFFGDYEAFFLVNVLRSVEGSFNFLDRVTRAFFSLPVGTKMFPTYRNSVTLVAHDPGFLRRRFLGRIFVRIPRVVI